MAIYSTKTNQLLAYADDVDIIGNNIENTARSLERESKKVGLAINKRKTKFMRVTTGKQNHNNT